jgi:hypothetical protein
MQSTYKKFDNFNIKIKIRKICQFCALSQKLFCNSSQLLRNTIFELKFNILFCVLFCVRHNNACPGIRGNIFEICLTADFFKIKF